MQEYLVSARKYRPKKFEDVVGQSAITDTLKKSIAQDRIAQALLFCGPRGVGKTSCARILAKEINHEKYDTLEDFSLNVFELDAASNNSVDDIRNLNDQVRIPPQVGDYKVYIIDEVHMLSQAAFNAFLKTLEEPPEHAIFVLATTEKHKIIPTILSRCQIYDFKRVSVNDLKNNLKKIAEIEGIETEDEALHIIAVKGDGAVRDSLSLFDRVVAFGDKKITKKMVLEVLNILDYDYYFNLLNTILSGDFSQILVQYDEILKKGFDHQVFLSGLAKHFRDLLVAKDSKSIHLLEYGEIVQKKFMAETNKFDASFLLEAIEKVRTSEQMLKTSLQKRLVVEVELLNIAGLLKKKDLTELKSTLSETNEEVKNSSTKVKLEENRISTNLKQEIKDDLPETKEEVEVKKDIKETDKILNPKIEKPKPAFDKKPTVSHRKSFSINQHLQKKDEAKKEAPKEENLTSNDFDQEDLKKSWQLLAQKLRNEKQFQQLTIIASAKPVLVEKNKVEVQLPTASLLEDFKLSRNRIGDYIKEKLDNYRIEFIPILKEEEKEKLPFTPEEKFKYLSEQNHNLKILKEKLNLNLDL